ncbi:sigma factor-like helix-turn-helix DNA-binding protein [Bradyrhizobium acaciae]|uniref:sigma factor-like helix-turn-helix DNA-binding protein n=1 Tax=Bradyrhizobium acaciae TaxID=2683706 RepID=UPI003083F0C3
MRNAKAGNKTVQQFRDAALPWLDDAYALAQILMRTEVDAEQAVQDCYLRALRQFDGVRGPAVRCWLLAILRAVCRKRRGEMPGRRATPTNSTDYNATTEHCDAPTIRQLIGELPAPLGEVIALRDVIDLSYKEIAEVTGVPVTTVMSRIADARGLLLAARRAANKAPPAGRTKPTVLG